MYSIHKHLILGSIFCSSLLFGLILFVCAQAFNNNSQKQLTAMGGLLSQQIASLSIDLLVAGDKLGLSVFLNQLVQTPYIVKASVSDVMGQEIASTQSKIYQPKKLNKIFKSNIYYQNSMIGALSIELNETLFFAYNTVSLAIVALLLIAFFSLMCIFWHRYGLWVLGGLKEMMQNIAITLQVPTHKVKDAKNEIEQFNTLLNDYIETNALTEKKPDPKQDQDVILVCICNKNLEQLRKIVAYQPLIEAVKKQSDTILKLVEQYHAQLHFTPEGNMYIQFYEDDNLLAVQKTLECCSLIQSVNQVLSTQSIANINIGIGICVVDGLQAFPETKSPQYLENAASNALFLARLARANEICVLEKQQLWFVQHDYELKLNEYRNDVMTLERLATFNAEDIESMIKTLMSKNTQ